MQSQSATHLTRHIVEVITRKKNKRRSPVMMAPAMLVAAKVIPRRITEVITVPKIPRSRSGKTVHRHLFEAEILI